jgi:hypothetical protein
LHRHTALCLDDAHELVDLLLRLGARAGGVVDLLAHARPQAVGGAVVARGLRERIASTAVGDDQFLDGLDRLLDSYARW